MQPGRNIRHDEPGILDLTPQFGDLRVRGLLLEPGYVAEPQFDAIPSRFFHEFKAALKRPALGNHVVADGFFHGTSLALTDKTQIAEPFRLSPGLQSGL